MLRFLTEHKRTLFLALLALIIVGVKTALTLHMDFNLADESFVWYGMQRVSYGDVPLRDYMAYDPARYYWGALFMAIASSKGLIVMRVANAVIEWLGLFLGLTLIGRGFEKKDWIFLLLGGITLSLWTFPAYKVYDQTSSIALICALAYLVESPTIRRYFFSGLILGFAAFVGRNHGVYGIAATALAVIYINLKDRPVPLGKAFFTWLGGVFAGYSPAILMMIFVPGFANASIDMIRVIANNGTNLPLPVPWPWRAVPMPGSTPIAAFGAYLLGFYFLAFLVFGTACLVYVFYKKWKGVPVAPALAASSFLILPYAHYAFSRADTIHVSFGGLPLFIGVLLFAKRFGVVFQSVFAALFLAVTYPVVCIQIPGYFSKTWVDVDGSQMKANLPTARATQILHGLESRYASHGESFLVVPFWPGAYTMFERRSPIWDLYSLFPRDAAFQEKEVVDIEKAKPAFILIVDEPPDGNTSLLFRYTSPIVMQYIQTHYVAGNPILADPHAHLYLPRQSS